MPMYEFQCDLCGRIDSKVFPMLDAPRVGWIVDGDKDLVCCGESMVRIYSRGILVAVLKPQNIEEKRPQKQLEKTLEAMNEPLSLTEIREGKALLAEREKQLGKPEGTLTTGRPKPVDQKDFDERVKPVAAARAKASRAQRSKGPRKKIV